MVFASSPSTFSFSPLLPSTYSTAFWLLHSLCLQSHSPPRPSSTTPSIGYPPSRQSREAALVIPRSVTALLLASRLLHHHSLHTIATTITTSTTSPTSQSSLDAAWPAKHARNSSLPPQARLPLFHRSQLNDTTNLHPPNQNTDNPIQLFSTRNSKHVPQVPRARCGHRRSRSR